MQICIGVTCDSINEARGILERLTGESATVVIDEPRKITPSTTATPKPTIEPAENTYHVEYVKAQLLAFYQKTSKEAAMAKLKAWGVESVSQLDPCKYGEFLESLKS